MVLPHPEEKSNVYLQKTSEKLLSYAQLNLFVLRLVY
jgi:hypothetical protein